MNFICVESLGNDHGIHDLCRGSSGEFVDVQTMLEDTVHARAWAGCYKRGLHLHCVRHGLTFYNTDSAYFGDSAKRKSLFRLSRNSYQNLTPIVPRPQERLEELCLDTTAIAQGSSIVLVLPDEKACHRWDLGSVEDWIASTCAEIGSYSSRPVRVRTRPTDRSARRLWNSFEDYLREDAWAVVGYSSVALVEAARHSIPVVALGPSAVCSLYNQGLACVEDIRQAA